MMRKYIMPLLGLVTLLASLFAMPLLFAGSGSLFAYTVLTNTDVDKVWKKAQGKLMPGFNFVTREFKWVKEFSDLDIEPSLRSMEFPVDIYEDRGITSLPEGGREAEPMSRNAVDATVSFIHLNGRFTVAKRARWALSKDPKAGLENQLKFQGKKKMEALGRVLGDQFYGFSNGYLCQTSTNATQSSGTYTLYNLYGSSSFAGTGSTALDTAIKKRIADLFKVGDRVALIRSAALVSNAIGEVTAVSSSTPSITVTWAGSVDSDAADYVVHANGASATTIAHTSYSRHLVGLLDMMTSDSVHGIAASSVTDWSAAYSDTAAGRFNGQKWRKALDEIQNLGDEEAEVVTIMDQGVRRDVHAQYSAGVRYDDTDTEIDGDPKARGKKFRGSKRVPPGAVLMFVKGAVKKKTIYDNSDSMPSWGNGKELIDDSGWLFPVEWSGFIATTNRKTQAYFFNQTIL